MENRKYDVVVCGAGSSGIPAAIAAARQGAKVALLEENSIMGGSVANFNIQLFCGVHERGIYGELAKLMKEIDPDYTEYNCFKKSTYILAYGKLMRGLDIDLITNCKINKVEMQDGKILSVSDGKYNISGKVFIDCTGDGDVFALANCEFRYGREAKSEFNEFFAPEKADGVVQQCTLLYSVKRLHKSDNDEIITWSRQGEDTYLIWGPTIAVKNTLDEKELAEATAKAYEMLDKDIEKWEKKGYVISDIAPKIGVRESRRFVGDHILSLSDILAKRHYEDSICVVGYAVDPWEPEGNPQHIDAKLREICVNTPQYEIPYRSIKNKKYTNLLVGGRCISASHVANSSLRVMVIAAATGTAAGFAASICINDGVDVNGVDTLKLRKLINDCGIITCLNNLPENLAKKENK